MARLLVSVCVALVVLQLCFQQGSTALPSGQEIVQKIKNDLFKLANGSLSQVQQTVTEVEGTIKEKVVAEVTKVKTAIEDFKEKIHQQAQAFVDKAEAEGKAVENCKEKFGNGLAALKLKGEDAIGCIVNPVAQIKNLTEGLIQAALSINDTVGAGQASLEKCKTQGGIFEQTTCQITTGGQLITQVIGIGTNISNLISQAANLVTSLPTTFQTCETNVWSGAMLLAANSISDLNTCIKSL